MVKIVNRGGDVCVWDGAVWSKYINSSQHSMFFSWLAVQNCLATKSFLLVVCGAKSQMKLANIFWYGVYGGSGAVFSWWGFQWVCSKSVEKNILALEKYLGDAHNCGWSIVCAATMCVVDIPSVLWC